MQRRRLGVLAAVAVVTLGIGVTLSSGDEIPVAAGDTAGVVSAASGARVQLESPLTPGANSRASVPATVVSSTGSSTTSTAPTRSSVGSESAAGQVSSGAVLSTTTTPPTTRKSTTTTQPPTTQPPATTQPPTTQPPATTQPPTTTTTTQPPPTTQPPAESDTAESDTVEEEPAEEEYAYDDPRSTQVWYDLADCESHGNWSINTGNGYYGGLQFSKGSWDAVGGTGYPHEHPAETQIEFGRRLQARQGWGAWPHCSRKLGLR